MKMAVVTSIFIIKCPLKNFKKNLVFENNFIFKPVLLL